jgi:hypothetical protein
MSNSHAHVAFPRRDIAEGKLRRARRAGKFGNLFLGLDPLKSHETANEKLTKIWRFQENPCTKLGKSLEKACELFGAFSR